MYKIRVSWDLTVKNNVVYDNRMLIVLPQNIFIILIYKNNTIFNLIFELIEYYHHRYYYLTQQNSSNNVSINLIY